MKKLSSKDKALHQEFVRYGRNAREWMHKCVLMLPKIEQNRIWEKKGFDSIYEYARIVAGMSRYKVNESLRILRKIGDRPDLMSVAKKKGITAVKPIATIVTKENSSFWAEKAKQMSKNTLEVFVRDFRAENNCGPGALKGLGENKNLGSSEQDRGPRTSKNAGKPFFKPNQFEVFMFLEEGVLQKLKKFKGGQDWNSAIKKLLEYGEKGIEAEKREQKLVRNKPKAVKTRSRKIPKKIEKYVNQRSQGVCEYPNCYKDAKHIHHVEPFALTRTHNPDNLKYVCEEHHKIIHLGLIDEQHWQQIEKLPYYDIKNLINRRILDYRSGYV